MRVTTVDQYPDLGGPALSYESAHLADRLAFLGAVRAVLQTLFVSDAVSWNAIDRDATTAEVFGYEDELNSRAAGLLASVDDHPMVNSYADARQSQGWAPRRLSDVVSRSDLQRTRAYADLMHPFGAEFQLTIMASRPNANSGGCWSLVRSSRDFDDGDRARAELLQPALVALFQCWASKTGETVSDAAESLGLTTREIQVLNLVARGLTADACAHSLRISVRTVRKHLENAYPKLGCHDRVTAVERLRQLGVLPAALPLKR